MEHDYEVMKLCVIDYLKYIRSIEASMREVEADIAYQNARLNLMGISYDSCGGGVSCQHDAIPDGIIKLIELRDKWSAEYCQYADDLDYARSTLSIAHMGRYALWHHYVDGCTWDVVARKLGYSMRQVRYMAKDGIREVYHLMPEEFRRDAVPNAMPQ